LDPQGRTFGVVIVGAGFSGLGTAIRLKERGIRDFVVLERGSGVGGAWHYNTYPGCRCDVPSHLYSFSFAPNPRWSQTYSAQEEIREYLRGCVEHFGLASRIRTNVELLRASWDEVEERWELETSDGVYHARVLVGAMGPLADPKYPDVPGLESFRGKMMHSARWDHEYDLTGKRVASIGTGASAIQYVPEIQPQVERLLVFQRTAPWVMPHGNRPISERERTIYSRIPATQRLVRGLVYASRELLVLGFAKAPRLMRPLQKLALSHMHKQIADPELRRRVRPDYALGCKRLLPSNRWYGALQEPNVELVTAALSEVRENSVIDGDGAEHAVDAIIFGTGFHVADPPVGERVFGRGGRLLNDAWEGSPEAYLGTAVPGFPNLFLLLGPNTGLGHSSMVYMIESQIEHLVGAIETMRNTGASTIEVRAQACAVYNATIDRRLRGTVWETGCASFYRDANGRNAALWPDWTWRFRRLAASFDGSAYALAGARAETPGSAPAAVDRSEVAV
jgi:cation diffusion facilitator CzcD-associated flavoprotein CzcO